MKSFLHAIAPRKTTPLSIEISGGNNYLNRTYTTNDKISGNVKLEFDEDTVFDDLKITFKGCSFAKVPNLQPWSHSSAAPQRAQNFLIAHQPIESHELPASNTAKGKTTYTIPFAFVVPDQLLDYACTHETANESVRQAHVLPPPSMGKPEGCNMQINDLTPDTVRIAYLIQCSVKARPLQKKTSRTFQEELPVHIIPTRSEEPPLHITEYSQYHKPRAELDISEGMRSFGKHTGRLIAETQQPLPLRIPFPHQTDSEAAVTMTTIRFRYEPATCEGLPPRIGTIKSKLHLYTYSAIKPFSVIPDPWKFEEYNPTHKLYCESVDLLSHDIGDVEWTPHRTSPRLPELARSNNEQETPLFYTSSMQIPITFGQHSSSAKKIFVPSFSSCLVCRNYGLEIRISRGPQQRSSVSSTKSYEEIVDGTLVTNRSEASSRRSSIASSMLDTCMVLKVPIQLIMGTDQAGSTPAVLNSSVVGELAQRSHEATEDTGAQPQQSDSQALDALDELTLSESLANYQLPNRGDAPPEYQPTSKYR